MKIIKQGKYECAAACLSQITGIPLFHIKKSMGKFGWCNDSSGVSNETMREAMRLLGYDLITLGPKTTKTLYWMDWLAPCILTVPSLNYKDKYHAISFKDGRIIDPNEGYPGRQYYKANSFFSFLDIISSQILINHKLTENEYKEIEFIKCSSPSKTIDYLMSMGLM